MSLLAHVSLPADVRPSRPPSQPPVSFLLRHLGVPGLGLVVIFFILSPMHGDFWWADHIYAWGGHAWAWQHSWLTQSLLHEGGRKLSALAWLVVAGLGLSSWLRSAWSPWRRPLLYLLLATAATTLLVGALKRFTDMDCPWDLLRYGGARPFVSLWQLRPDSLPAAACFPAGHAGGGYSWVALYFFFRATRPEWRWRGLGVGLGLGLLFGMAQQWRGAHFASHDVATLAIAWFVSSGLFVALRVTDRVPVSEVTSSASLPQLAEAQS
ncbi:Membrane-associated enzyme, PAP2 (acid phosphatase) superfamily [Pseudoxanthomonas indica]|uniref:Membrane-associated enzyme, PAP2 (Acid phosphatase) superfamily n=1 Tax=Pseudoxanthomonas indica TaxID=428993 RepID=A0A1T5KK15_9GAMM|nr:Membrane-associated enzyme, PAP2 (acid phosphatase) superfamily [Pseudoxanthomonas indica]